MALKDLVRNYAQNSSAHGLPKVARSQSVVTRLFWIVICTGAVIMFIVQGIQLLQRFYSYPKSIRLEVANQPVPFPAVSICNLRPMDIHTLWDVFYDRQGRPRWTVGVDRNYTARPNSSVPCFEDKMIKFANLYYDYYFYSQYVAELRNDPMFLWKADRELLSRLTLVSNLNACALEEGGIKGDEFIARCQYAAEMCTPADFKWFMDPAYFNCFTFNATRLKDTEKTIYEGPDNGLSLVLFVPGINIMNYSDEVLSGLAMHQEMTLGGEGIRVVIHRQNTVPYPLTEGMDVPRGISASIGLKLSENIRMSRPHGNCTARKTLENSTYTYTLASCKKACLQKKVIETCNCGDVSLPSTTSQNISFCATLDDLPDICRGNESIRRNFARCSSTFDKWFQRVACMRNTRANVSKNLSAWETCQCDPSCHDIGYSISYSLSDWPVQEQAQLVMNDLLNIEKFDVKFSPGKAERYFKEIKNKGNTFKQYKEFIDQKHFMRLNVYISDTSVIKIVESEEYGLTQLISDVGGQLGLWIGVSIITLVEMVELVYYIVRYLTSRRGQIHTQNVHVGDQNSNMNKRDSRDWNNGLIHLPTVS